METTPMLLISGAVVAWLALRARYQRTRIALLGHHLADLQIERHMETLTQGYTRAIHEEDETRQIQVLRTFEQTEQAVATQVRSLADRMQTESTQDTRISLLPLCVPYVERFLPAVTRDFRALLYVHAAGLHHVVNNVSHWEPKERAFHLSAELYLFQHSCHWFCKSRGVADARLSLRHQVKYQQALDSVSNVTRSAYLRWREGSEAN